MASGKSKGWNIYEIIGIVLPNMYQCKKCNWLINCLFSPDDNICHKCRGEKNSFEKKQPLREVVYGGIV